MSATTATRLPILLAAAAPAGVVAACFAWNVAQHHFLVDDAFISFRYASHLVEGHGLVWNPGERVEGYTNFLWVLLMAAGLALGSLPETTSVAIGIASGAGILTALAVFSARSWGWRSPWVWLAPAGLVLNRSFGAWSTGGLETQLFSLWLLLGLLRAVGERADPSRSPLGSGTLFALAALTRPEGVLFAGVTGLCFGIDVVRRRRSATALALWCLPLVLGVGGHLLFRIAYYGEWLPNTFYAKVGGAYWSLGVPYLRLFFTDYPLLLLLPLVPAVPLLRRRWPFETTLLGVASAVHLLYLAYIGGDRFEFRFVCPILPLLYWLIADALRALALPAPWAERPLTARMRRALAAAGIVVLLGGTWRGSTDPAADGMRSFVTSVPLMDRYTRQRTREGRLLARLVAEGRLPPDLRIAVSGAGALPYYSGLYTLDVLGLTDHEIARQPLERRGIVGHERQASFETVQARGVDVYDVLNGLIWPGSVERLPRRREGLPLRALRVGNFHLVFATTLSEPEFRETFRQFDVAF